MKSNQKSNGRDPRADLAIESTPRQEGYTNLLVHLVGVRPLLMHNPGGSSFRSGAEGGKKKIPTPEEEAAAGAYWTSDESSLMVPAEAMSRCIGKGFRPIKVGKTFIASMVAGGLNVYPDEIPLGTRDYAVDTRRARVQRQGVLRSRPKIWPWDLWFAVSYHSEDFPTNMEALVGQVLNDAGIRIGLLDFRPECTGRFGVFRVEKIERLQ